MDYSLIEDKLKQLKIENFIWIIYIGIIIMSWYANNLEKNYFLHNNLESKEKYRKIMILIFTILLVVYLYFLKDSCDDIKNINDGDSDKKKNLMVLSFVASLLIVISGLIFLYIAYQDEELDVELAFS